MYFVLELLFYVGVWLIVAGFIWSISLIGRGHWLPVRYTGSAVLLGLILILVSAANSRQEVVDLGPRLALVGGEKHITLTDWNGSGYAMLRAHPETTVLQLANTDVTDETLDHISVMANLRELDLNDSQVTDAGLAKLAKLSGLETLRLRGTKITDHGLIEFLGPLPQLRGIDLRETSVSSAAVETWLAMVPGRRALYQ